MGAILREKQRMKQFRNAPKECKLFDVGYSGQWYTWERGHSTGTNIKKCLDKGVTTIEWMDCFPTVFIHHLTHSHSDHCPLLIQSLHKFSQTRVNFFKCEAWWTLEPSFEEEVKNDLETDYRKPSLTT